MKDMIRSHDAFISKPDICFSDSISFVVIGSMSSFWNRKDVYCLSILLFSGENETRNRRYPFIDKPAYFFNILLRMDKIKRILFPTIATQFQCFASRI